MPTKHLDRIVHFFEADHSQPITYGFVTNLKAMVAQQLIPTPDGHSQPQQLKS